jgi:predicted RNA binding protein YcfA (HicA-like mRNA interferase family)
MMSRRGISFRDFIARVKQLGFVAVRQRGSHIRFEHPDGRKTTVPDHGSRQVPIGLLTKIVRQDMQMLVDDFFADS